MKKLITLIALILFTSCTNNLSIQDIKGQYSTSEEEISSLTITDDKFITPNGAINYNLVSVSESFAFMSLSFDGSSQSQLILLEKKSDELFFVYDTSILLDEADGIDIEDAYGWLVNTLKIDSDFREVIINNQIDLARLSNLANEYSSRNITELVKVN